MTTSPPEPNEPSAPSPSGPTPSGPTSSGPTSSEATIPRRQTLYRVLLTILFSIVWGLGESLLGVLVGFGILWSLIAQKAPPARVRSFSNHLVAYLYRVARYLTYNDPRVPFPFSDFPHVLEPPGDPGSDPATELRDELDSPRGQMSH